MVQKTHINMNLIRSYINHNDSSYNHNDGSSKNQAHKILYIKNANDRQLQKICKVQNVQYVTCSLQQSLEISYTCTSTYTADM